MRKHQRINTLWGRRQQISPVSGFCFQCSSCIFHYLSAGEAGMGANTHRVSVRCGWALLQPLQWHPRWWIKEFGFIPWELAQTTSFIRYSWNTSPGGSSWSFTQGLSWSMVRATFRFEFCTVSQVFPSVIISYDRKLLMGYFTGQTHILLFP